MRLIDTHTHLDFPAFDADRADVWARSQAAGVERALVMGVAQAHWSRVWALVEHTPGLYAAFGLHPLFIEQHQTTDLSALRARLASLAGHRKLCAVGEIGLDFFLPTLDRARQIALFEAQLAIAYDAGLPALLHVRRAHAATLALLKRYRLPRGGVVHAFSGSFEEAKEYLKLGFKIGLGGAATWPQAQRLRRMIAQLPEEAFVLETDAPDMAPAMHPYGRNSPEFLPAICTALAAIRGQSPHDVAEISTRNACRLFEW